jgi:hypothetical protein
MPRVCNREGCGKRILGAEGNPDYRKHFCGSTCLKIDKRERLQAKRSGTEGRRCSHCGRKPVSLGDNTDVIRGRDGDPRPQSVTDNSDPIAGTNPSLIPAGNSERAGP